MHSAHGEAPASRFSACSLVCTPAGRVRSCAWPSSSSPAPLSRCQGTGSGGSRSHSERAIPQVLRLVLLRHCCRLLVLAPSWSKHRCWKPLDQTSVLLRTRLRSGRGAYGSLPLQRRHALPCPSSLHRVIASLGVPEWDPCMHACDLCGSSARAPREQQCAAMAASMPCGHGESPLPLKLG